MNLKNILIVSLSVINKYIQILNKISRKMNIIARLWKISFSTKNISQTSKEEGLQRNAKNPFEIIYVN